MNSILNPEAPEFRPLLNLAVQNVYTQSDKTVRTANKYVICFQNVYRQTNKTVRTANKFPIGNSYEFYKTFTDFNIVTSKIRENVVLQSNQIILKEVQSSKLKCNDWCEEENTEKIIDANDGVLDRININIDTKSGVNKLSNQFLSGVSASWNHTPVIAKIKAGKATFIGAKNIPRPQLCFKDTIDNSDTIWVPKITDKPNNIKPLALSILYNDEGQPVGYEHPYCVELELYEPPANALQVEDAEDQYPPPLEETLFTYVDTCEKLDQLVAHLDTVEEFAVDLEHHSYRTYQGITCLIQITTSEGGDFIIDTLAIREHVYKLNQAFTDPKKIKVFHGAESDILWLQRDFGVYVVGLFDTHQAARLLHLSTLSLKYLLMKYCNVSTDKKYQLADWRMRPLPKELVEYARMDTHYLLYIWRQMRRELLSRDTSYDSQRLLRAAFDNSKQVSLTTYNKPSLTDTSHLPLYHRSKKSFSSQQMAALKALFRWRDEQARDVDESTMYLLPNHMLLSLAETLPREMQGVLACCSPTPPFIKQHVLTVHRIILSCRELPDEAQLYATPPTRPGVGMMAVHAHIRNKNYIVHDLAHMPEFSEEYINLEQANAFVDTRRDTRPDLTAFDPLGTGTHGNNADATSTVVSNLNAEAQMFVPPYDRYRAYRAHKQVQEMKEMKEKEAKVSAISRGDPLIREEVLVKLQRAQDSAPELGCSGSGPQPDLRDDNDTLAKQSQRKRKIIEKTEQKDVTLPDVNKKHINEVETDSRPVQIKNPYKQIEYNKFYSGAGAPPANRRINNNIKFKKL